MGEQQQHATAGRGCGAATGSGTAGTGRPPRRGWRACRAATVAVSRTSSTTPVPRLRYQSRGPSHQILPRGRWARRPCGVRCRRASTSRAVTSCSLEPGRPRRRRAPGRRCVAVLAATQVGPVAVTVRQGRRSGRPVRGSSRWWRSPAPVRQRRASVLEVGEPAARRAAPSRPRGRRRAARSTSTGQAGSAGGVVGAVDADVAAEADQHVGSRARRRRSRRRGRRPRPSPVAPRSRAVPARDPDRARRVDPDLAPGRPGTGARPAARPGAAGPQRRRRSAS